jgi:ATP-binding cassette subfamily B (MDR/TAP) protein 1
MSRLNQNVLYYVYIGIAEFGLVFLSTVCFHHTGERIARRVREEYLAAILRQNMAYFDNLGAGEVTTRISADANLVQDGISQKVGLTMSAVAAFVSSVIIAYVKYWKLALIATPSIICLVGVMVFGFKSVVDLTAKAIQSSGDGSSVAGEAFSSIRTVAAFGSHEKLAAQYDSHLKAAEKHGVRMQVVQALMLASLGGILFMTQGLCLWQGARFLVEGEVHVGQVLTIMMAVINGSFSLGGIAPNIQAFANAMAAASRIYSTIDRESPIDPTSREGKIVPEKIEGHIELRNVTHAYPSRPGVVVAKDVNLVIPAGQTTALVGPSGSGKSTIISLLERFYDPVQGAILLDGHDIQSLELRWLRQQMSLVSQEPAIFSTTILENIIMGLPRSVYEGSTDEPLVRELVEKAARMANAHDFIVSLPEGYDTCVGEQGLLLSGGQKQRIAIARAVVGDPKILLLDEATSALDTKSEQVVQVALDKAAAGRTTIVIAHRLSTIKSADNIVVLAGGRVVEQGTHDELTDANGLYSRLVQAQSFDKEEQSFLAMRQAEISETEDEGTCQSNTISREDLSDTTQERIEPKAVSDSAPRATGGSLQVSLMSLIKFIGSFNRPERKLMVVGLIFVIVSGGVTPAQSVIYSKAIASLSLPLDLSDEIRTQANRWALLLFVLGVASLLTNSIHLVVFGISVEKMIHRARAKAFRTILRQDVEFFDREENSTGALLSFLSTETKNLAGISGVTLSTILILAVWLTAASVIALALGWKLALVCIAIVPLVMGCGFWRVAMLADFQARAQKAYEASTSYACEAVTAVRTVASLGREDAVLASYHRQLLLQTRAGVAPSLKSTLLYAAAQGVYYLCTALAFWYGGTLLARHEYSIFQFFVVFTQIVFSVNSASAIFASAPDMAKAKNAAAQFKKLLHRNTAADAEGGRGAGGAAEKIEIMEGCIEFRHVCFRYPTRPTRDVVSDLSFTVRPGQYAALVGASGCGKSTTIALLERFYDVLSGCVCVDGKDISSLDINSYRSHLALVGQEPVLYQGTIRENILVGTSDPNVTEEAIVKACKDADIYDLVLSLP